MSTYTPCFPSTDITPPGRPRPITSSNSSGTSISGSPSPPKLSYSARLSQSHLALASVSEYISRPPSPTSAAVDTDRVTQLRRKFRLAVDATYRDTSNGKWAHVSEMAKLGSTRGRWQGMCSGSSAPCSPYETHEQKKQQGKAAAAAESADPYPRPPVPVSDFRDIRERVENWKANVLSAPLSQAHSQGSAKPNQPIRVGDARQPSPLCFPTVRQCRSDVTKAMKHQNRHSRKGHSTSRYFRGAADPKSPDGAEGVTTCPFEPRDANVDPAPHSRVEVIDEDQMAAQRHSPAHVTTLGRETIQQVSELFLPPSFPSHLQTSTPPPLFTAKKAHRSLTHPPEIPRAEDLRLSASPPPFPPSQDINRDPGSGSQPISDGSPSSSRCKRPLQDSPSPAKHFSKQRLRSSSCPEEHSSPPKSAGASRRDLHLSPTAEHVPVIDLRQLVSSQRSRAQSRHSSFAINSITPLKDKGKDWTMTADISPS